MKITRSTKCSLKFATKHKQEELQCVLSEYGKVVNIFIDYFWKNGIISKTELLKPVVDIPETWLSARLRKVAAREALDMVKSVQEVFGDFPGTITSPYDETGKMEIFSPVKKTRLVFHYLKQKKLIT